MPQAPRLSGTFFLCLLAVLSSGILSCKWVELEGMGVLHLGRTGNLWPTTIYSCHLTLLFYTVSTFHFLTPTGLVRLLFILFFSHINLKVPYFSTPYCLLSLTSGSNQSHILLLFLTQSVSTKTRPSSTRRRDL